MNRFDLKYLTIDKKTPFKPQRSGECNRQFSGCFCYFEPILFGYTKEEGGMPLKRPFFLLLLSLMVLSSLLCPAFAGGIDEDTTVQEVELPIVMYHHLSYKPKLWGDYVLSVDQFERDLIYLKKNDYTTITTSQLMDWCEGSGVLPEKPVMITFDDGYESTLAYALPLLEKYQMHAVVAIIGSVAQQYTDIPDHNMDYSHMNWDAISQMDAGSVIEIQCHTYDMHKLSNRKGCGKKAEETYEAYQAALTKDFDQFQTQLKNHTGHTSDVLALPFGFYSRDTIEIAKTLGFRMIFTCTERINYLTGDLEELLELCRFNRPSGPDSASFFAKWNR